MPPGTRGIFAGQPSYARQSSYLEEHLRRSLDDAAIHIQCTHMHKELDDLVSAEQHYIVKSTSQQHGYLRKG
jgi:hypothetical protein